ncbi:heparin lyase I family protein [Aphanothece hegewaldii]|nr:heparin lyase I family protein [Aphanothece hegewaldii]
MLLPTNYNTPGRESYTITQQMGYQNTCWVNANGPNCNNLLKLLDGSIIPLKGAPINALRPSVDGTRLEYHLFNYLSTDSVRRHLFALKIFTMPAMLNKWQDFVMYLDLSSDPNEARFKLWKNDKLYINEAVRLLPPGVGSMGDWKYGAYNGEPGNGERTLYTDELRVGDSASTYLDVVNPVRRDRLLNLSMTQSSLASVSFSQLDSLPSLASMKTIEAETVPEPTNAIAYATLLGGLGLLKRKSK